MPQYIAFLRAINVGGHNVKMDQLRALFEALGFTNVQTFIASGNVIFETPVTDVQALEKQIESHLHQSLGYAVATFIRTPVEIVDIAHYQPFTDAEGHTIHVAFLQAPVSDAGRDKLMSFQTPIDDFHIHEREIYWRCRVRVSESRFSGAALEKAIGMPATLRNMTTARKLAAKYGERDT